MGRLLIVVEAFHYELQIGKNIKKLNNINNLGRTRINEVGKRKIEVCIMRIDHEKEGKLQNLLDDKGFMLVARHKRPLTRLILLRQARVRNCGAAGVQ